MACFVAGTLVLTTAGLLAIEKINPGEGEGPDDPGTVQIADLAIVLFQILGPMIMLLRLSEMLRIVQNQFGNKLQVQEVVEMHRKLLVVQIQTLLLPQEMVDQLDLLLKDKTIV